MQNKVTFVQNPESTNVLEVFQSESVALWEPIFARPEWKTAIFQFPDWLKIKENRPFCEPFYAFFAASAPDFFMKPCCPVDCYNHYPILRIPCGLPLDEVAISISTPYAYPFQTNWEGDMIWNETATWGIHHSQYYWVLVLGYAPEASGLFEQYLENHPDRLSVAEFSQQIDQEVRFRSGSWSQEVIDEFLGGLRNQGLYQAAE